MTEERFFAAVFCRAGTSPHEITDDFDLRELPPEVRSRVAGDIVRLIRAARIVEAQNNAAR